MREGSGAGSGSIPLTNRSWTWRPKNMWIRWIRNRNNEGIYLIYPFTRGTLVATVRYRYLLVKFGNCAAGIEVKQEKLFSSSFMILSIFNDTCMQLCMIIGHTVDTNPKKLFYQFCMAGTYFVCSNMVHQSSDSSRHGGSSGFRCVFCHDQIWNILINHT